MQRPEDETGGPAVAGAGRGEPSTAARRALAEAAERRRQGALYQHTMIRKEIDGRDGPEPVRYGDWEVRGIASDF